MKNDFKINWSSYNKPWSKMDRQTRIDEAIRLIDEVEEQVDTLLSKGNVGAVCGSAEDCMQAYRALCEKRIPSKVVAQ